MSNDKSDRSRREFLKQSAMTAAGVAVGINALSTPGFAKTPGANDKIRVGFIGIGNRGTQLIERFMANPDVEVAALCDVYEPFLLRDNSKVEPRWLATDKIREMGESFGRQPKLYKDFRELLDQKDIDAVCIATPDHWHAVQTIAAIDAGKDVYVEKPLTVTIHEGRQMVSAAANSDRVAAVGLNRRGSTIYQELAGLVQDGAIGQVRTARACRISNMYPDGIGALQPEAPPDGFDWDMWLGPRPYRPYQFNIAPYYFRWWQDYSSQMGNWGVHYLDVIRWLAGETAPVAISAHGSKLLQDDKTIPDTMEATFEFANGMMVQFHIYEACGPTGITGGEIELAGTKGSLVASRRGYTITPAKSGQFQTWEQLMEPSEKWLKRGDEPGTSQYGEDPTSNLIRNFLDCIKSRETPWCTLEDGHRSTSFAHLANIALATGMRIEWDADAERVTNSEAANELLHYEYRAPWSLG